MCGICGFNWEDKALVKEMAASIAHRGPDQEGYFTDKFISLGHKRLSIIDLSEKGKQPMFNEEGSICIVYNGEIYNFQDIKPELEKKGHRFISHTDTEVIIHAYEEYGYDCLKLFNGMFAFAVWDSNKKELFIARDRIGIKPLYYYFKDNLFLFGSEIKAILQYKEIKREVNENCLKQIIYYAYPINGETLMQDIIELKPGHYLILKDNKISIKKYWDVNIEETNENENFYVKKLTKLLFKSVEMQLVSDVPLGISLSGGLDSSTLVAIATKLKKDKIKTFTVGFECYQSEFKAANTVAEYCGTDHIEIHLQYGDFTKIIPTVLWHLEVPFSRPGVVPIYYLSNKIRQHLTVSLAGEGADELFGGYNRYDAYTKFPDIDISKDRPFYENLKKKINMPLDQKIKYVSSGVFNTDKEEFFNPHILKLQHSTDVNTTFGPFLRGTKNDGSQLNRVLLYELKTIIPYFHCNKLDKNSMASSHEIRVPYLDHNIVEFAFTVPPQYKFVGKIKKKVLQKVAQSLLPSRVAQRKKLPLVVPLKDLFEKEFVNISSSIFSQKNIEKKGYYKIPRIQKLIKDIRERKLKEDKNKVTTDNSYRQLLFLTSLELWIRLFIENDNLKNPKLSFENYL